MIFESFLNCVIFWYSAHAKMRTGTLWWEYLVSNLSSKVWTRLNEGNSTNVSQRILGTTESSLTSGSNFSLEYPVAAVLRDQTLNFTCNPLASCARNTLYWGIMMNASSLLVRFMLMAWGKSPVASIGPIRVVAIVGVVPVIIVILVAIVEALTSCVSALIIIDVLRIVPCAKLTSIIALASALPAWPPRIVLGLESIPHALVDHASAGLIIHVLTELHHVGTIIGISSVTLITVVETSQYTALHTLLAPIRINILVIKAGSVGVVAIPETISIHRGESHGEYQDT